MVDDVCGLRILQDWEGTMFRREEDDIHSRIGEAAAAGLRSRKAGGHSIKNQYKRKKMEDETRKIIDEALTEEDLS
jgi:hypothetical protein